MLIQDTAVETLVHVPLQALRLAPENTRQEADPTALDDLKASIREQGLLQNLVGYREGDQLFIVAGGHRLRALQALAEEGFPVPPVPVRLIPKDKALIYSATENLARKDLTPLEEARVVAQVVAALGLEGASRELGRSQSWVEGRAKVARFLSPSWQEALQKKEIPFALAHALADLKPEDQEDLWKRYGPGLKLETLKALQLKDAVPVNRLLPGVLERYRQAGGVVMEALMEGTEYAQDRALALRLQEEAARTLAQRMGARFEVDLPLHRVVPLQSGGERLVVLSTQTLEVRVFTSARVLGEAKEAREEKPQAASQTLPATPASPQVSPGTKAEPRKPEPAPVAARGRWEQYALLVRAYRTWAQADPRRFQAAVVAAVVSALAQSRETGLHLKTGHELGSVDEERYQLLSGGKSIRERLISLLGSLNPRVEQVLRLSDQDLNKAFHLSLTLLLGLPQAEEPIRPTLGMADADHFAAYRKDLLEKAAEQAGLTPGASRKETIARLLEKPDLAFPDILWQI